MPNELIDQVNKAIASIARRPPEMDYLRPNYQGKPTRYEVAERWAEANEHQLKSSVWMNEHVFTHITDNQWNLGDISGLMQTLRSRFIAKLRRQGDAI